MTINDTYSNETTYVDNLKRSLLDSSLEKITYNEDMISSKTYRNYITGTISINYLGIKGIVYQSDVSKLTCEMGTVYVIDSKIRQIISEGEVVIIDCPLLKKVKAKKVTLYRCPQYNSIECDELTITGTLFHDIIVRKNANLSVAEGSPSMHLKRCVFEVPITLPVQQVTLTDTICQKIIFKDVQGNVTLKGKSQLSDLSGISSIDDQRPNIIEQVKNDRLVSIELLKQLPDNMKNKVIGQDFAVESAANMIRRALLGYGNPNTPLGVLLLSGPTGVGKTQLSKEIVSQLQNILGVDMVLFKRFDLAEYQHDHMLVQLIGAPRGYQDHSRGGVLTNFLKKEFPENKKGVKVVLLDEFEKMHPRTRMYFLSLFDEGHVTDTNDNVIDAKNTFIIATTNLKGAEIARMHSEEGFALNDQVSQDNMLDKFLGYFESVMSPELLNRFDKIIFFHPLNHADLKKVIQLKLDEFSADIYNKRKLQLTWESSITAYLINICEKKRSQGVRALEKTINDSFRDLLATKEVNGNLRAGDTIKFFVKDDQVSCEVTFQRSKL